MPDPIVYGFPRSTYVNIVRLILTHKDVPYVFHDLEPAMGKPEHLALHPFNRVPILRHGDFTVYETSAIVSYIDEAFDGPRLTPRGSEWRICRPPERSARLFRFASRPSTRANGPIRTARNTDHENVLIGELAENFERE